MGTIEEYKKEFAETMNLLADERKSMLLNKITKPSKTEEVLSFDYSDISSLAMSDLEKYMGALSQYLVFINSHINEIVVAKIVAEEHYNAILNQKALQMEGKTITEKQIRAENDTEVKGMKSICDKLNARHAQYKNIPDSVENLINTIKKVYDAKIKGNQ